MNEVLTDNRVIPVVVLDDARDAAPLGRALLEGGITTAEVTFRTDAAADAIRLMSEIEGITVGAGTVTTPQQAEAAIAAGAQYVVSPGFSRDVVQACLDAGISALPACTDGSWLMAAQEMGLRIVKFFPAEALGGISTIKALSAPFPGMSFVPTGGIGPSNLAQYLAVPAVKACGGSWMVKRDLIAQKRWSEISELSRTAVDLSWDALS